MRAWCVLLLALIAAVTVAAPATVAGRVVGEAGGAIAGATVWIVGRPPDQDRTEILGRATTDGAGAFSVPGIDLGGPADRLWIQGVAYREGLALGWADASDAPEDLLITCLPPVTHSGRLLDTEGKGRAARVVPETVVVRRRALGRLTYVHIVGEMADALAVPTDADGRFAIAVCPPGADLLLGAESAAFGKVSLRARGAETGDAGDLGDVVVAVPGSIRVRAVCEADPQATRGLPLRASGGGREGGAYSRDEGTTGDDGTVLLQHVQPGKAQVLVRFPHDARRQCAAAAVTVTPGETAEVEVELLQAYEVTGRVVDAVSKAPIAGVRVRAGGRQATDTAPSPPTGTDGVYRLCVLPGETHLYVQGHPEEYLQPDFGGESVAVTVSDGDQVAPDIVLTPATGLEGAVVDAAGNPVPRALVYGVGRSIHYALECDGQGRFRVMVPKIRPAVGPGGITRAQQVWARAGDRMTREPVVLSPGRQEPVRLVVEDGVACRVALCAVYADGRPVADAEVSVKWSFNYMGVGLCTGRTGADGVYTGEPVWPFGSYSVTVVKPGHRRASSEQWEAAAGQTHDLGPLVMARAAGVVAGRVVDTDGDPVAGATVTANGEGPGDLTTQTDAAGTFRLEGLYEGVVWVVARSGDSIGGAGLQTGTEDGTLGLAPLLPAAVLGEPRSCASCTDRETDRRVARELLEVLTASASEEGTYTLLKRWAMLDAERAFELAAGKGDRAQQAVLEGLARRLLAEDPQEAIACLESLSSQMARAHLLADAADRLREAHPDLAAEVAQRAIDEARSIAETAARAVYLSRAAEALYDIDPQAAAPVLREARSLAEKLGYDGRVSYARGCVAAAICRLDLEAALDLLAEITDDDAAMRYGPGIAARIAATNPEEARELMEEGGEWQRGTKMPRVVYAMAPAHPDTALDLARGLDEPRFRARSLGYVALALREQDPARAMAVLREAVETVSSAGADDRIDSDYDLDATCGELAFIASRMGHPGSAGLCLLVLSLRPGESIGLWGNDGGCKYLRSLALADPRMAAELVRDVYMQPGGLDGEPHAPRLSNLAVAAAACDANLAAEVLRALDARVTDDKMRDYRSLWVKAIDCLLTEPQDRPAELLADGGDWVPGARGVD